MPRSRARWTQAMAASLRCGSVKVSHEPKPISEISRSLLPSLRYFMAASERPASAGAFTWGAPQRSRELSHSEEVLDIAAARLAQVLIACAADCGRPAWRRRHARAASESAISSLRLG